MRSAVELLEMGTSPQSTYQHFIDVLKVVASASARSVTLSFGGAFTRTVPQFVINRAPIIIRISSCFILPPCWRLYINKIKSQQNFILT
jgi:hypothetical protein